MNTRDYEDSYEDPSWEACRFDDEELSFSRSVVARGQFGASYVLVCKLILVFEYCANGNLHKILQKGRPYYNCGAYCPKKAINNEILSDEISLQFSDWHLLKWATEIARGMEYLAFKGVVHADLAARNILLTCDWTAKISNFGIGQRLNRQESYANHLPKETLPIAWMSPETIQNFNYSTSSDVWSYGICLWEIYSLGDIPYKDENLSVDLKFFVELLRGLRPRRPNLAGENMWDLMTSCWSFYPDGRPTFSRIKTFLDRTFHLFGSDGQHTLSPHDCEDASNSSAAPKDTNKNKTVSFDVGNTAATNNGGFIKKCFDIADEVISKTRKLSLK